MQLNNNRTGLNMWLHRNGFPSVTDSLVVMANSKVSVRNAPADIQIMYAKHLPYYFRMQDKTGPILTDKQMHSLADKLRKGEKRYDPYPLCEKNGINPKQIRRGLICDDCDRLLERKNYKVWSCRTCIRDVKQAYEQGIKDWFMLIKDTISNKECREFLQLKDKYAANYILKKLPLKQIGRSTTTHYMWDYRTSPADMKPLK